MFMAESGNSGSVTVGRGRPRAGPEHHVVSMPALSSTLHAHVHSEEPIDPSLHSLHSLALTVLSLAHTEGGITIAVAAGQHRSRCLVVRFRMHITSPWDVLHPRLVFGAS
jgi:hypothetical protein